MKIAREIKIGFFFLLTLALFIWGYNYLKGKDLFSHQTELYAIYDDIGGLDIANPVFLNGLKIGQVKELFFEGGGSTRIVVKMLTSREVLVPINSKVIIYSHDLMGSRAINLILGKSPIMAQNGDTLVSGVQATLQEEVNRQVQPIKKKAEDLLLSIDSVVTTIQTVLNADARSNLAQSFESIRQTISTLEHTTYTIDTLVQTERKRMAIILENIESITTNLRNNNKILTNTIHNIHAVTDSLTATNIRQTFTKLETTLDHLNSVLVKIDNAEGTLGILINDPSLYRELESSSNQLNQLIEDMKLNPKRYLHFSVFGRSGNRAPFVPAPGD